jgi:hypothetical protein
MRQSRVDAQCDAVYSHRNLVCKALRGLQAPRKHFCNARRLGQAHDAAGGGQVAHVASSEEGLEVCFGG